MLIHCVRICVGCWMFSSLLLHYMFWNRGLSVGLELNSCLDRLATKLRNPPVSVFLFLLPVPRYQMCSTTMPNFYVGAGYLNSSPHANITCTLLTEPSPQALFEDRRSNFLKYCFVYILRTSCVCEYLYIIQLNSLLSCLSPQFVSILDCWILLILKICSMAVSKPAIPCGATAE